MNCFTVDTVSWGLLGHIAGPVQEVITASRALNHQASGIARVVCSHLVEALCLYCVNVVSMGHDAAQTPQQD